eukprot:TRINITY_DN123358_c0_g1_i1.p2 TRINITY_DN123358_c0_g1~~TRINITY_DN123358_c0_g1_i1.p2  ORF type:complete len:111 (+),score=23.78 TRINITY_DN123358_c0_g1_i1:3-335(+)
METINKCLEYFSLPKLPFKSDAPPFTPTGDPQQAVDTMLSIMSNIALLHMTDFQFSCPTIAADRGLRILSMHLVRYNSPMLLGAVDKLAKDSEPDFASVRIKYERRYHHQ